jgi:hypothetical protein
MNITHFVVYLRFLVEAQRNLRENHPSNFDLSNGVTPGVNECLLAENWQMQFAH